MQLSPKWMVDSEKDIGLTEIAGPAHESRILNMWQAIKMGGIKDDETPWCAAYVGAKFETVGIRSTRSGWAKSYLNWGVELRRPVYGAVVVFSRAGGGGHVGFAVGYDAQGRVLVQGGNQGNAVSIRPFDTSRVLSYRWPSGVTYKMIALSTVNNNDSSSTNEA